MAQITEGGQPLQHSDKRQFRLYNILVVMAMSLGSMSYGYSASKSLLRDSLLRVLISGRRHWFDFRYPPKQLLGLDPFN